MSAVDAYITLAIALVVIISVALAADVVGDWRDRRRDPFTVDVERAAREREALGRSVWGRRGR